MGSLALLQSLKENDADIDRVIEVAAQVMLQMNLSPWPFRKGVAPKTPSRGWAVDEHRGMMLHTVLAISH